MNKFDEIEKQDHIHVWTEIHDLYNPDWSEDYPQNRCHIWIYCSQPNAVFTGRHAQDGKTPEINLFAEHGRSSYSVCFNSRKEADERVEAILQEIAKQYKHGKAEQGIQRKVIHIDKNCNIEDKEINDIPFGLPGINNRYLKSKEWVDLTEIEVI